MVDVALAQEAAGVAAAQPSLIENLIPFVFIFAIMYFLMIRPQAKKAREHMALVKALKVGDEVVTSGGIIAKVRGVADEFVSLEAGSTHLKVMKENIVRLITPDDRQKAAK